MDHGHLLSNTRFLEIPTESRGSILVGNAEAQRLIINQDLLIMCVSNWLPFRFKYKVMQWNLLLLAVRDNIKLKHPVYLSIGLITGSKNSSGDSRIDISIKRHPSEQPLRKQANAIMWYQCTNVLLDFFHILQLQITRAFISSWDWASESQRRKEVELSMMLQSCGMKKCNIALQNRY